jgi:glutamate/tyrosine decarboxylase-like PLP-dependent enzyme
MDLQSYAMRAIEAVSAWQESWGHVPAHPASRPDADRLETAWSEYVVRLRENYPIHHPRYTAHMLRAPHPVAIAGYLAAMLHNPNNHGLEGGPATSAMEKELVRELAAMFRLPAEALGHLTSSGTIANLEALFVARELRPGRAVAFSGDAHYTHERMSRLLGVDTVKIASDRRGRIDLDALEAELKRGRVGTVVLSAGTTGLGAVDPIADALALRERYGCRLHVDGAWGGFYVIPAWAGSDLVPAADLEAIAQCDSVVVDPHKHGLQPYGCGAVLFRDPTVARFYVHDSPYTYFTSDDLHLGEISLECSRAGAAAAALWLTSRVFPFSPDGLGAMLDAGLRAARDWEARLEASEHLRLYQRADLSIVTYFPAAAGAVSEVDAAAQRLLDATMYGDDPVFASVLRVEADDLLARHPDLRRDAPSARINRSVLMKPENETYGETLHRLIERAAAGGDGERRRQEPTALPLAAATEGVGATW